MASISDETSTRQFGLSELDVRRDRHLVVLDSTSHSVTVIAVIAA